MSAMMGPGQPHARPAFLLTFPQVAFIERKGIVVSRRAAPLSTYLSPKSTPRSQSCHFLHIPRRGCSKGKKVQS